MVEYFEKRRTVGEDWRSFTHSSASSGLGRRRGGGEEGGEGGEGAGGGRRGKEEDIYRGERGKIYSFSLLLIGTYLMSFSMTGGNTLDAVYASRHCGME